MPTPPESENEEFFNKQENDLSSSESEPELRVMTESPNPERFISDLTEPSTSGPLTHVTTMLPRRPSGVKKTSRLLNPQLSQPEVTIRRQQSSGESSDSESEDGANKTSTIEGLYNPKQFEQLQVSGEIKELFQHIMRYTPQKIELDYKFKPFIPEFIPAVGDTDAFLKVITPIRSWADESFNNDVLPQLGLEILDEPAAVQSDASLLYLQLRATTKTKKSNTNMNIKKVENMERNSKAIDQWIKDISDLHRTHPPPTVIYHNEMPDIDDLLQDWPKEEADALRDGFPDDKLNCSIEQYIELVCSIFDIPVFDSHIESLHVFFGMCLAVKNYYLYVSANEKHPPEILQIDTNTTNKMNRDDNESIDDNDEVVF